jgi:hypothetical protein
MAFFKEITIGDVAVFLKNIINLLQRPIWTNPATGNISTVDTVTGATTFQTVNTLTKIGELEVINPEDETITGVGAEAKDAMLFVALGNVWRFSVKNKIG